MVRNEHEPYKVSAAINLEHWNERVPVHLAASFYDVGGFLAGDCKLKSVDLEEVGDVRGKRLLHLQCHFGLDTLSWARRGAEVVGLDYSAPAITAARELAERAKLPAEFVEADVYDAPAALSIGQGRVAFDIVVTGVGALCWLPKIEPWAKVVADCVKPGGFLYLREGHPMMWAMADRCGEAGHPLRYPYFEVTEPSVFDEEGSYADAMAKLQTNLSHNWNHGLGETISALIQSGFTLELLHEHTESDWQAFPHMVPTGSGMWKLPEKTWQLPLMYSLRARRVG